MNPLTWHIVKKDYRYLRPYLDIWWSLLVANALAAAWCIQHIFHESAQDIGKNYHEGILVSLNWFFLALDILMLGLVVDAILKNDSPIDEKAFWRTRPVDGGRMFRAKLISIGLFCFVVPGAIQAAGHLAFGFSWSEFIQELEQFAVIQGGMIAVATGAAVLFQRTIMGLLAFACFIIAFIFAGSMLPGLSGVATVVVMVADLRNVWVFPGIFIAAVIGLAALIYTGHRRRTGFFVLACGIILMWPAGFCAIRFHKNPPGAFLAQASSVDSAKWSVAPSAFVEQPAYSYSFVWRLHGWITNPTLPELGNSGWQVQWTTSDLSWPGEKATELNFNTLNYWKDPVSLINAPAAYAAAGYGRLIGATAESWRKIPLGEVNDVQLTRLKKEPAKLATRLQLQSGRLVSLVDLPAQTGSIWRSDMTAKHLVDVSVKSPASIVIQFDELSPWHSRWFETEEELLGHLLRNTHIFLLYNSKTKECLEGTLNESTMDSDPMFTWQRAAVTFDFAHSTDATGKSMSNSMDESALAAWLADARLTELQFIPTQNMVVPFTIDTFQLPTNP